MDTTITLPPADPDLQADPRLRQGPDPATRDRPCTIDTTPVASPPSRIRLWDLPTRLFHWGLVAAVSVAVATGWAGGDWMRVHGIAGLTIAGLVVFRVVWGFVGSTHSRFSRFAPTPRRVLTYLRGRWTGVGHNPLGAASVFLMLGLLAAQVGTGLFGNDDIAYTGPLAGRVDDGLSLWLTGLHRQLAWALLAFLALHVLAIAFHAVVKKDDLLRPMVTGYKETPRGESTRGGGWLALLTALAAAGAAVALASGATWPQSGAAPLAKPPAVHPQQEAAPPAW